MHRFTRLTLAILCLSFVMNGALAADAALFSVQPVTNHGQKWRLAYYEGGPYIDYQQFFAATIRGLMKLGWIETADLPQPTNDDTQPLWQWLATTAKSDYLEFPLDAYYSAQWINQIREETVPRLTQRLTETGDIDMLIAMGTMAGQDFSNNRHTVPTMVISSSDPIAAGIIKSAEDSGFEHVHAAVDPKRAERQVRIFHEIIDFKKLGMAFEDSVNGRSFAAIDRVKKVAEERGFEIVPCFTLDEDIDDAQARDESVKECFQQLAQQANAIYVTQQGGINQNSLPELVRISNEHKIPTFSQAGSAEVKLGILLSLSQAGFRYIGEFHAQAIAKVFNGAKPNQLEQLFEDPPKIAINLKTAELIGFDPPIVLLGAADEIFHDITKPE